MMRDLYENITSPTIERSSWLFHYDKCPENYDLRELMERADFAVTYLGDKIRAMVANAIPGDCMSSPPKFVMFPNHDWEITGYVQLCDSPIRYGYFARLYMQTSETDRITISRSDKLWSETVDLTEEDVRAAVAKFPPI